MIISAFSLTTGCHSWEDNWGIALSGCGRLIDSLFVMVIEIKLCDVTPGWWWCLECTWSDLKLTDEAALHSRYLSHKLGEPAQESHSVRDLETCLQIYIHQGFLLYDLCLNHCVFLWSCVFWLSYRLVSQCLFNCSRECSECTTVTGSTLFRKPL